MRIRLRFPQRMTLAASQLLHRVQAVGPVNLRALQQCYSSSAPGALARLVPGPSTLLPPFSFLCNHNKWGARLQADNKLVDAYMTYGNYSNPKSISVTCVLCPELSSATSLTHSFETAARQPTLGC